MKTKDAVSLNTIESWIKSENRGIRELAMIACQDREIPFNIIEQGLKDEDFDVYIAAQQACHNRDIPLETIKHWLKNKSGQIHRFAEQLCKRIIEIPSNEIIEHWLKDENYHVRAAAEIFNLRKTHKTFNPPELVYKKCLNDVIVVASIPEDAWVRGKPGEKCRASKAKIVDVIGDVDGVKIGFSIHDRRICYVIGDEIEIEDFDTSSSECSSGFHFFCTKEEAENYHVM